MSEEKCSLTYKIVRAHGYPEETSPTFPCDSLTQARERVAETKEMLEQQGGWIVSAIAVTESGQEITLHEECEGESTEGDHILSMFVTKEGTFMSRDIIPPITCSSIDAARKHVSSTQANLRQHGGWIISATVNTPEGKEILLQQGRHPC